MAEQDTAGLLQRLLDAGVDFVVVGGVASFAHGSTYAMEDLDIAVRFEAVNLKRLLDAIEDLDPRYALTAGRRGITESAADIAGWKKLYIWFDAGRLDVLGEMPPVVDYDTLRKGAERVCVDGRECLIASIDDLIAMKGALGRPKDVLVVEQLVAIRDRR